MATRTRFSKFGLPYGSAVDMAALSDYAAAKPMSFAVPVGAQPLSANSAYFVINASTDHVLGPLGVAGVIVAASISHSRLASLGAGSFSLYAATTDGTTKTLLTNTLDPETGTANVGRAFTIASTTARAATDVIFLRCTADNNTVTTDVSSVRVTLWVIPTDTAPTRGGQTAYGT